MASIFGLDKQIAHLPKHGFPMSEAFAFTSSCGHILPIFFDQLNPGEKFRYSVDMFTRTQPLSAPANLELDEYIDVFFVPLKKISSAAENILFQLNDMPSSSLPPITTEYVLPTLDLSLLEVDIIGGASNQYLGTWSQGVTGLGGYAPYFESNVSGMMRLFDHLQVDPLVLVLQSGAYRPAINPAAFAVYQSIYYDYFRLSNWETNQTFAYNLDAGYTTLGLLTSGMPWATSMGLRYLLQLHYRAWYKDYFTNVFPSPLISSTNLFSTGINNLVNVNNWLISNGYRPVTDTGVMSLTGSGTSTSPIISSSFDQQNLMKNVSTSSLRTLFAVDKLLKITARAGKHYDDQVLAHFGFKVPKGYSNEVVHLGQHHQVLHVGEVISTASTTNGALGELAGKGYGKGSSVIVNSFTAPCHGYVMAVYSSSPKIFYYGGLSKLHSMVLRYDWFIPELDNLGMQPLFMYEQNILSSTPTGRAAWQLRYSQMKSKYPRCTYAFKSSGDIQGNISNDGPFAEWLITDPFEKSFSGVSLGRLLVSPCMLNQLMLVGYVPTPDPSNMVDSNGSVIPEALYATDPLIHFVKQSVSKISAMSIYGLDDKAI